MFTYQHMEIGGFFLFKALFFEDSFFLFIYKTVPSV